MLTFFPDVHTKSSLLRSNLLLLSSTNNTYGSWIPYSSQPPIATRRCLWWLPFLRSTLNNPSIFPWRPMCFRSLSPDWSLLGSYLSCSSCKWVKLFHWSLISADQSKIITFDALLLPFLEPGLWSSTSTAHVQPGTRSFLQNWCLASCFPSAADCVELYVQFCICSNLTAGNPIVSRMLHYFIFSLLFSTALLPTHLFCSMNLLSVCSNLSSKLSVRILNITGTREKQLKNFT